MWFFRSRIRHLVAHRRSLCGVCVHLSWIQATLGRSRGKYIKSNSTTIGYVVTVVKSSLWSYFLFSYNIEVKLNQSCIATPPPPAPLSPHFPKKGKKIGMHKMRIYMHNYIKNFLRLSLTLKFVLMSSMLWYTLHSTIHSFQRFDRYLSW